MSRTTRGRTKTRSELLRITFYKIWEKEGGSGEFEDYYNKRMDSLIKWIQDKQL